MDSIIIKNIENAPLDKALWLITDWHKVSCNVRRIQNRIVKAVQKGCWRQVRSLQRLMTQSLSAKLMAVKRVVDNSGNRTPGIDNVTWRSAEAKSAAVLSLTNNSYKAKPLKRVYIPKSDGNRRPLGIPTVYDRAVQALHKLSLEPITETLADSHSYGFRPKRCQADAIAQCFNALSGNNKAEWVLEGDIQGCFDNIHHEWLLNNVPMNSRILRQWLKAGFIEKGMFFPTKSGTPQGGIISPVLMNWTLDGLSKRLDEKFGASRTMRRLQNKIQLIRYADDFIVTGFSPEILEVEVKPLIIEFLRERGLKLSPNKTHVTSIHQGFNFLGQTIRKYRNRILLITPSKNSQKAFQRKVYTVMSKIKTSNQAKVVEILNPIITGWGNYHRYVVSKAIFAKLDHWIWMKTWRWACRRHPNKRKTWVAKKYYQTVDQRSWEFVSKDKIRGNNIEIKILKSLAKIPITRHVKIKGEANPYDISWELYLEERDDQKMKKQDNKRMVFLYKRQNGKCEMCGLRITSETKWNIHHKLEKVRGGSDKLDNLSLLHPHCHRQLHSRLHAGMAVKANLTNT